MDEPDSETHGHPREAAKAAWAKLIRKAYEVDPLVCPKCGAQMRIIALIKDPAVIERIPLLYSARPHYASPLGRKIMNYG